jgi:hypothetical protein
MFGVRNIVSSKAPRQSIDKGKKERGDLTYYSGKTTVSREVLSMALTPNLVEQSGPRDSRL